LRQQVELQLSSF